MPESTPKNISEDWKLTPSEIEQFNRLQQRCNLDGSPMIEWGWKRDEVIYGIRKPNSRTVYFSADLAENNGQLDIARAFFFLETRAKQEEIQILQDQVGSDRIRMLSNYLANFSTIKDPKYDGYENLRMVVGNFTNYDLDTVWRRLKGKPRLSIPPPRLVPESNDYDLSKYAPFALCVGSGLSAESGLPLLGAIHELFEVDDMKTRQLIFGAADNLPRRIIEDVDGEFRKFSQFTVDAIKAEPSSSHKLIAELYKKGVIRQVFTDNMDGILDKVDVPYTRTRLSIFPDRFPATFDPEINSLLVVGVAVDRRDVIKQARKKGLKIIAINPIFGVAPHSRNMDYLRLRDMFFKEEAKTALPSIIQASNF